MFFYSCYKVPCLAKEIVVDIINESSSRNFPQATLGRGSIVIHAAPRCSMLLSIMASSQPPPRYVSPGCFRRAIAHGSLGSRLGTRLIESRRVVDRTLIRLGFLLKIQK